jgi:hypothetical protein
MNMLKKNAVRSILTLPQLSSHFVPSACSMALLFLAHANHMVSPVQQTWSLLDLRLNWFKVASPNQVLPTAA